MSPEKILDKYWGFSSFRSSQKEIIDCVLQGGSAIALMPTGGGKSICYQVPALIFDGITIVISPLISLMEDQVNRIKKIGISADCIHSGKSYRDVDRILDNCIYGDTRIIYVSPERLVNELFIARIKKSNVSLIAVDEAHCISQWGHDFRPAYLNIHAFRELFPKVPVLALTATATGEVIKEIKKFLNLSASKVFRESFLRKNIFIEVLERENGLDVLRETCKMGKGKTIVYVRSRRQVKMIASILENEGTSARFYHAGLGYKEKQKIQKAFFEGKFEVIVATNAFGMGIDVPDVRAVIHYGLPSSLEEYYQEIGRAGRDGQAAIATLIYSQKDVKRIEEDFQIDYPPFEQVISFYKLLHVFYNVSLHSGKGKIVDFKISEISRKMKLKTKICSGYLHAMERLGFIKMTDEGRTREFVKISLDPRSLRDMMANEENAGVVEAIVRKFPGIFDDWTEIESTRIIRGLQISKEQYEMSLKKWSKRGVLKYFIQKTGPKIIFLMDRLPTQSVGEFQRAYERLRKLKLKRSMNVLSYLKTTDCRSVRLLEYFDESMKTSCMNCDNCNYKPLKINDYQITQLDERGICSVFHLARRSNNIDMLDRIQRLHDEGLIHLPSELTD